MRHPPIRCTLVECMPVRYVPIFENGFVVLDAERELARMLVLAAAGCWAWGLLPIGVLPSHSGS
jgi:hypothetical protein